MQWCFSRISNFIFFILLQNINVVLQLFWFLAFKEFQLLISIKLIFQLYKIVLKIDFFIILIINLENSLTKMINLKNYILKLMILDLKQHLLNGIDFSWIKINILLTLVNQLWNLLIFQMNSIDLGLNCILQ